MWNEKELTQFVDRSQPAASRTTIKPSNREREHPRKFFCGVCTPVHIDFPIVSTIQKVTNSVCLATFYSYRIASELQLALAKKVLRHEGVQSDRNTDDTTACFIRQAGIVRFGTNNLD